jgi:two-component system, cell cycle sensor histidine kinase and response regulator CckA
VTEAGGGGRAASVDADDEIASLRRAVLTLTVENEKLRRMQSSTETEWAILRELLPHAVYVFDLQTQTGSYLNGHLALALGYESSELHRFHDGIALMHPDDLASLVDKFKRWDTAQDDEVLESEYRLKHKDGTYHWFLSRDRVFARDASGKVISLLGTAVDVTARKVFEQDRMRTERLEAMGRLAGGIAHDFNNLLTVVRSTVSLAARAVRRGQSCKGELDEIDVAAREASLLTHQLLTFSRREAVIEAEIDVAQVTRETAPMLRRLIEENIEIAYELSGLPLRVRFARAHLVQILLNLAVNARDAMKSGGKLSIAITLEPPAEDGRRAEVVISVTDTGEGIPTEVLDRIFEPFFTTKGPEEGTGIGLATVDHWVRQGGGRIGVRSDTTGTTFQVRLPSVAPLNALPAASEEEVSQRAGESILLCEDNPLVRRATKSLLEEGGYVVTAVCDGEEAMTMLRQRDFAFDLVLSDVVMPKKSGYEIAAEVKRRKPTMPVLLWSGYPGKPGQVPLPSVKLLDKPVEPRVLFQAIRDLLDG